jgi:hypothetical protein
MDSRTPMVNRNSSRATIVVQRSRRTVGTSSNNNLRTDNRTISSNHHRMPMVNNSNNPCMVARLQCTEEVECRSNNSKPTQDMGQHLQRLVPVLGRPLQPPMAKSTTTMRRPEKLNGRSLLECLKRQVLICDLLSTSSVRTCVLSVGDLFESMF